MIFRAVRIPQWTAERWNGAGNDQTTPVSETQGDVEKELREEELFLNKLKEKTRTNTKV